MYAEKLDEMLKNHLKEAGFKTKKEFTEAFNLKYSSSKRISVAAKQESIFSQNTAKRYITFFEWAIKAHKLSEIENLTKENQDLKKEIAKIKDKKQRSKHA